MTCSARIQLPAAWRPCLSILGIALLGAVLVWLSPDESHVWGIPWPWEETVPLAAAINVLLLVGVGALYAATRPAWRSSAWRPLLPLRARTVIFYAWLFLNAYFYLGGIRNRDFAKKPGWLSQKLVPSRATGMGEGTLRALRIVYNCGMAAAWPLLANLFLALLPVERSLLLLAAAGAGHEDGVAAHTWVGTAVAVWACVHALLTQAVMLAAGLWALIMLPPGSGLETKAVTNFMGLMAWLCLCGLGATSLSAVRRARYNLFIWAHVLLAPAVFLFASLHSGKVFWYGFLGLLLYGADVVQRLVLRRRTAAATVTVYPQVAAAADGASGGGRAPAAAGAGGKFVVLRIHTAGSPGCFAGQHVFLRVPRVSPWQWHPYSVAASDDRSFAVVVKAHGDWERRLAAAAEEDCALEGGAVSTKITVAYEGFYGTPDLQAAAAAADRVLLFAGGSGITPLAALLQSLLKHQAPLLPPAPPHNKAPNAGSSSASPLHGSSFVGGAGVSGPLAAAAGGGEDEDSDEAPRVHLVWAVTQESDAAPLMPLLRAAADRGWWVDLHVTRPQQQAAAPVAVTVKGSGGGGLPADPHPLHLHQAHPHLNTVAVALHAGHHPVHGHHPPAQHGHVSIPSRNGTSPHHPSAAAKHKPPPAHVPLLPAPATVKAAAAAAAAAGHGHKAAGHKAPPPLLRPWQLSGAACWAVAAAAAALGALGRVVGRNLFSSYTCAVGRGAGGATAAGGIGEWVEAVRFAFTSAARAAAAAGHGGAADAADMGVWRRLMSRLAAAATWAAGDAGSCPPGLAPQLAAAGKGGKLKATAEAVALRACRAWGQAVPELCVKCDPFEARSPLHQAWPCCKAKVCFYGVRAAPVLGWVLGAAAGATLACWVWRAAWRRRRAAAAVAAARGLPAPYDGYALRQPLLLPRRADWLEELKAGVGLGAGYGSEAADGGADGADASAAEEGYGGGSDTSAPGIEPMLKALGYHSGSTGAVGLAAYGGGGGGGGPAALRVHYGRPDPDAYIQDSVARLWGLDGVSDALAATGGGGAGTGGEEGLGPIGAGPAAVVGVVVCGPEALQAAAAGAFSKHLVTACPSSWFRGFSFTT
ncbi:hypothetical protein HXX76_013658 [Chlamydomonas incerta]|uniref:FAD-binding FR-type domain-containing protein n=1 Tax=Chlamydomonas incerta TaxID=51695 RepID=A0A835SL15_CHLIN|nr:hypothetical protein HXX76_013658 [Chlamydomonas incerta]|eukprot:KAG2425448.1 hypothetical protein HXX76_013658 [Chlamydomonas incerta]